MIDPQTPSQGELPTAAQLLRSTIIAIVAAAAILVTVVLPAEYGIDPTGIGRALGLAEMGEIKQQLADEAERDKADLAEPGLLDRLVSAFLVGRAAAETKPAESKPAARTDETTVTLKPGQGSEIKLVMKKGATVEFAWTVAGGAVNFDLHGDAGEKSTSYEKGRASKGEQGVLEAAFDGSHGWFWRNRGSADVTVTLRTSGAYSEIKRIL